MLKNVEDPAFMGWGMDFRNLDGTLYYDLDAGETHRAGRPEQLLEFYEHIAQARLEWLAPD